MALTQLSELQAVLAVMLSFAGSVAGYDEACIPYMELLRWLLSRKSDTVRSALSLL